MSDQATKVRKHFRTDLIGGLIVLFFLSFLFTLTNADLSLQSLFYKQGMEDAWPLRKFWLFDLLYNYGSLPAGLTGAAALILMIISFAKPAFSRFRWPAIFLVLVIVIGPGLLINSVFKMSCGHPRPREVHEFSGKWDYQKVYTQGEAGRGRSFPCGHCSMGFFFLSFYFLRRSSRYALLYLAGGIIFGLLIGGARMSAGAHFPADVAFSGIVVYFSALFLYYKILRLPEKAGKQEEWSLRTRVLAGSIAGVLVLFIAGGIALATPYYREFSYDLKEKDGKGVQLFCDSCTVEIIPSEDWLVSGKAQGFGLPGSKVKLKFSDSGRIYVEKTGMFTEAVVSLRLQIPSSRMSDVVLRGKEITAEIDEKEKDHFFLRQRGDMIIIEENR